MKDQIKIGIIGGGQLGRMLALAGYPLGMEFSVLENSPDCPAAPLAEMIHAGYADPIGLARLANSSQVVTYEFENIPTIEIEKLANDYPVYPPVPALKIAQDRIKEKTFFAGLGIPVPRFAPADTYEQLQAACEQIGFPCVVKTTRFGYDGKGQSVVHSAESVRTTWDLLQGNMLIVEEMIPFDRELSIIAVRRPNGEMNCYPLIENTHSKGILRFSEPYAAADSTAKQAQANRIVEQTMQHLNYVGVLTIELFDLRGKLLVNEMAPRVHNSGHWTIEGAVSSQFENHLRAITDLPLGSCGLVGNTKMWNLIGSWPPPETMLRIPGVHLHLYGKAPRYGRKVGHVTYHSGEPLAPDVVQEISQLVNENTLG
ncbi:MAG: 5-(carboxyamino)imidazole ribonucleotide synthase [Zavarzinella sp.]